MFKRLLKIYVLSTLVLCGCEKEKPSVMPQPKVSIYEQMLLKGDVEEVVDTRTDAYVSVSKYRFDDKQNLEYHEYNGSSFDDFTGLRAEPFVAMHESYAFFICPDTWTQKRDTVMEATIGNVRKKIEYTWDESGKFTDVRCYIDEEPIAYEGVYNMAGFLYYDNGYPSQRFILGDSGISFDYKYSFSDFDEKGNPLKISVDGPDQDYVVDRVITYRK